MWEIYTLRLFQTIQHPKSINMLRRIAIVTIRSYIGICCGCGAPVELHGVDAVYLGDFYGKDGLLRHSFNPTVEVHCSGCGLPFLSLNILHSGYEVSSEFKAISVNRPKDVSQ